MNTQYLDLLTKACDEIVAAKEAIANAESKIAYIREQIQQITAAQQITNATASKSLSETKITKYSDFPQPRDSRVKEILAGVRKTQEPAQQGESKESNVQTYTNNEIGGMQVETIDRNGIVFFKLTDIEKTLELTQGQSAKWVKENWFDSDEIVELRNSQLGGHPLKFVAESGLYRILNRTNSPKAKPFERWVTKEVLPSIRKTGSYQIDNQTQKEVFNLIYETPCREAVLRAVKNIERDKKAKVHSIKEYTITEKLKNNKVITDCKIGVQWDTPPLLNAKEVQALNQRKRKCQ